MSGAPSKQVAPPAHRSAGRAEPYDQPGLAMHGRLEWIAAAVSSALGAGVVMALVLMAIGEIASEPTTIAGIDSSTWTALTGIAAFLFGLDAFHGDFHVLAILAGLGIHLGVSLVLGAAGVWFIAVTQGPQPGPAGALIQGAVYGLFLQVFLLNLVINGIQDVLTVYESIPQWGWWIAHAAWGGALGLLLSRALGSGPRPLP